MQWLLHMGSRSSFTVTPVNAKINTVKRAFGECGCTLQHSSLSMNVNAFIDTETLR